MSDYNLKRFGYTPGPYSIICSQCQEEKQDCDKRAHTCHECALSLHADELQSSLTASQKEVERLRSMLCRSYSEMPYMDDGEMQDNRFPYPIDFKRDSIDDIEAKMIARTVDALKQESSDE